MFELDPTLRSHTEALLHSTDCLRGASYLHSPQRQKVTNELTRMILPFAVIATAMGQTAVKMIDGHTSVFYRHTIYHPLFGEGAIIKIKTLEHDASEKERILKEQGADVRALKHENGVHPFATRAGRWLRKLGIDEAPQIPFNVRGDHQLTLVGPRPRSAGEWCTDIEPNKNRDPFKTWIHHLTDDAQIPYGWLSPYVHLGRSALSLHDQTIIESAYMENASETVDRRIVGKLIGLFFKRNGR